MILVFNRIRLIFNNQILLLAISMFYLLGCSKGITGHEILTKEINDILILKKNMNNGDHHYQAISIIEQETNEFAELYEQLSGFEFFEEPIKYNQRIADYVLENSVFSIYSLEGKSVLKQGGRTYTIDQSLNDILSKFSTSNDYTFKDVYGRGEFGVDSYTWCSTVPIHNEYEYKEGYWKFWSKDFNQIASGMFQVTLDTIDFDYGCGVHVIVKTTRIDPDLWDWSIEESERHDLLNFLENVQRSDTSRIEIPVSMD